MGPRLSAIGVLALLSIASSACGGDNDQATTAPSPVALERCPPSHGGIPSGAGWGARVSGISCDEVGQFIQHEIFPRASQIANRSHVLAAGYSCDVSNLRAESGWRVTCDQDGQHFAFDWTP
jgi:hypothetical protein